MLQVQGQPGLHGETQNLNPNAKDVPPLVEHLQSMPTALGAVPSTT